MKDGKLISMGTNEIHADIGECPRDMQGFKTGKGYHLCKEVCLQKYHAEVDACMKAGKSAEGGTLYLMGHTYACDNCIQVMENHKIARFVIAGSEDVCEFEYPEEEVVDKVPKYVALNDEGPKNVEQ